MPICLYYTTPISKSIFHPTKIHHHFYIIPTQQLLQLPSTALNPIRLIIIIMKLESLWNRRYSLVFWLTVILTSVINNSKLATSSSPSSMLPSSSEWPCSHTSGPSESTSNPSESTSNGNPSSSSASSGPSLLSLCFPIWQVKQALPSS